MSDVIIVVVVITSLVSLLVSNRRGSSFPFERHSGVCYYTGCKNSYSLILLVMFLY